MAVTHEQNSGIKPVYEFIEKYKKFYCDGIAVQPWQMTNEEIKQYIPQKYQAEFFKAKDPHAAIKDGGSF